ncbi:hypothetical protein [Opitutus sp. ER46]|uniref:hypothetical protein n=1 Tax=Opitutus sp. ER46 TaxID=2161864 RepID=UPI0011B26354|nr:hypothetical protein [Opitutus sp. ER46]
MHAPLVRRFLLLLVILGVAANHGGAADTEERAAIRDFDLDTAGRLGRAIYEHDRLAWVATDVMLAQVPKTTLQKEKVSGWVVETAPHSALVRFLRAAEGGGQEAAYDVVFEKNVKPRLMVPERRALTVSQLARAKRLFTATKALAGRPQCPGRSNVVVLDDPSGDGLIVYVLRPKMKPEEIPVGGHYRVMVTANGETVKQVDQLFASCLTLNRPEGEHAAEAMLFMSHIVSPRPLETHVFLSLQEKLPFLVMTGEKEIWEVKEGRITLSNIDLEAAPPAAKP